MPITITSTETQKTNCAARAIAKSAIQQVARDKKRGAQKMRPKGFVIYSSRHAFAALEGEGFLRRLFDQSLPLFAFLHTINVAAREMVAVIRVETGIKEGAIRRGLDG
jgi:hypothetical protein